MIKYPRTPHLPFSPNRSNDDRVLKSLDHFVGMKIVILIKMDGENSTLYPNDCHARSLDSNNHVSRNWLKNKHASIKHLIPENYRICGENIYAQHTIHYNNLSDYFLVFSIWNGNICLSWQDTIGFCEKLGLKTVPEYKTCIFNEKELQKLKITEFENDVCEGFVIRNAESFTFEKFNKNIAKYVNPTFTIQGDHWTHKNIIKNELRKDF